MEDKHAERLVDAAYHRGSFINDFILMERFMDEFLCRHFAKDEQRKTELLHHVFGHLRITMSNKLDIFREMIDLHYPDFKKNYPTFYNEIKELIEQRNIFAHYMLDVTTEGLQKSLENNELRFIKFHKDATSIVYRHEVVLAFKTRLHDWVIRMGNLIENE